MNPFVSLEWLVDNRLAIVTVTSVSQLAINAWADTILYLGKAWSPDEPMRVVHDFSAVPILTPYIRKKTLETNNQFLTGFPKGIYAAVILPNNAFSRASVIFTSRSLKRNPRTDQRHFFDRQTGVAWLESTL